MSYEVTAVIEDNREETHKVCAHVECSLDAIDAIVEKVCRTQGVTPGSVAETWAILYLSCRPLNDGEESPLPMFPIQERT